MDYTKKTVLLNPENEDWCKTAWLVFSNEFCQGCIIWESCEQDAIDTLIDYCEKKGYKGLVSSLDELEEGEEEEYICGGNHGLYLTSNNVYISKLC